MADPETSESPAGDDLQFDRAEYQGPVATAPTCAACKQAIAESYYEVNGQVLCPRCSEAIQAHLAGGSGLLRLARASGFGLAAAVAGFGLFFGVAKLTGYAWSLISVAVGLLIGSAVRAGSRGRGGLAYQALATLLTYLSISASYAALIVAPHRMALDPKRAAGLLALLLELPVVIGLARPITLLIIGFALWEAWKLNRRARLAFNGPFLVGDGQAEGAPGHA